MPIMALQLMMSEALLEAGGHEFEILGHAILMFYIMAETHDLEFLLIGAMFETL